MAIWRDDLDGARRAGDTRLLRPARPFVGRHAQAQALLGAVAAAAHGDGGLVLVGGEAGSGKTRLADLAAGHARDAGLAVRWANCWRDDGAPALWPWAQLLRAHVRGTAPAELSVQVGSDAGALARLVPELADLAEGATDPGDGFGLFEGVARLLRRAAAARPLLLVLDDLHWADEPSLRLLRFLARELRDWRCLVVGTYRAEAGAGSDALLGDLGGSVDRLVLGGLAPDEVAGLAASLAGSPPSADQVALLVRRTGGNPMRVRELALRLGEPDEGGPPDEPGEPGRRTLSPRQWEVARLVADGLGNEEIAVRLSISRRTVETHVDHVRRRLDLGSRAAIVTWVLRSGA